MFNACEDAVFFELDAIGASIFGSVVRCHASNLASSTMHTCYRDSSVAEFIFAAPILLAGRRVGVRAGHARHEFRVDEGERRTSRMQEDVSVVLTQDPRVNK